MVLFKSKKARNTFIIVSTSIILSLTTITYLLWPSITAFHDPATIRTIIASYGSLAPVAFIALHILQILIAPIPGHVTSIASGYLFGAVAGTIYTMIGTLIGSGIAFTLARMYGRSFVERTVDNTVIKRFDDHVTDHGEYTIFLIFLFPGFPDDAICFLGGLTAIPVRRLLVLAFLGRLPGFLILNLIGAGIAENRWLLSTTLTAVALLASGLVYWYNHGK